MRYIVLLLLSLNPVYSQCDRCALTSTSEERSPTKHLFKPEKLVLTPETYTSITIYFVFPDSMRINGNLVYPNYAIWVDSISLARGLITAKNGDTLAYNSSAPTQGGIHFDQMHRYKQYDDMDPTKRANFVVYQNPGGAPGKTPPYGCVSLCIKTSNRGADTLRIKVRAFTNTTDDDSNKDTTNLTPTILGTKGWIDTTFIYTITIVNGLTVFSNPYVFSVIVRFNLDQSSPFTLRVFNTKGEEVHRYSDIYYTGVYEYQLYLEKGIYVFLLDAIKGGSIQKVVMVQ